jgi:hypothetical protein
MPLDMPLLPMISADAISQLLGGGARARKRAQGLSDLFGQLNGGGGFGQGGTTPGANLKGEHDLLFNQVNADLAGIGETRKAEINEAFDIAQSNAEARLARRGFGNSSGLGSIAIENQRGRQMEQTRLLEALAGTRASARMNIGLQGLDAQRQQNQFDSSFRYNREQGALALLQQLLGFELGKEGMRFQDNLRLEERARMQGTGPHLEYVPQNRMRVGRQII